MNPLRILVVDDEPVVAMTLEDMLLDMGHEVVGPAMELDEAVRLAETGGIDLAILDVNLGGSIRSYPVADRLRARGIPVVFATGYGSAGIDLAYKGGPILMKPVSLSDLDRVFSVAAGTTRAPD